MKKKYTAQNVSGVKYKNIKVALSELYSLCKVRKGLKIPIRIDLFIFNDIAANGTLIWTQ